MTVRERYDASQVLHAEKQAGGGQEDMSYGELLVGRSIDDADIDEESDGAAFRGTRQTGHDPDERRAGDRVPQLDRGIVEA